MKKGFLLFILLVGSTGSIFSQYQISGQILNTTDDSPLESVHVISNDSASGTVSDEEGYFSLNSNVSKGQIRFQAVGYQARRIQYKSEDESAEIGIVYLTPQVISLDEITIAAGLIKDVETPITVSTVTARTIQNQLGDQPLPLTLNNVPGVYSVRNGGGSGDAELSIRGFNQENVGVLVNGIPINGVENGSVYWSNWLGLSQAAAEIQIQKGPGFTNTAVNAVGGSINIVTEPAKKEKGGAIIYQITNYGNQKISVLLNSGKLKNGWSISAMGSFTKGPGYIDATYVQGWSYFLALSKQINSKNKFTLTLMGAPQKHGQRTLKLSADEHQYYGKLFNKDWGSINGQMNNASENFYHRPFLGLNHYLKLDEKKKLATSIYVIMGNGGGKWSESFNYAPTIFQYRNASGQIDWPAIYENNSTHDDSYILSNGDTVSGYSYNVQTHFLASHVEAGVISTYEQQFGKGLKFVAGIHYRYFNSFLREEIKDLLGGEYFIDDYSWAVDGVSGRNEIKTVGDIIKVNNNSLINYLNAYAQLIYSKKPFSAYVSINGNNNWYQRVDRYNYVDNTKSDLITIPGFDVRAGFSFSPSVRHTLYTNGAYISKAPYFKYVFGNFTNVPVLNLNNEQISTIEAGYRYTDQIVSATVNGFYTNWNNVSLLSDEYVQLENNLQTRAMINGLRAVHKGIEIEFKVRAHRNIRIGGFLILADYRWKNNVSATLFNNENVAVDTVNVFVENIYVGGTAQQQFGLFADFRILRFFNLKAEWQLNNKVFSNFNPTFRRDPTDHAQPFQFPSYNVVNVYLGIPFKFFESAGLVQVNAYNLLNSEFIEWGEDGPDHTINTFQGFWSFGRTFDFMIKLNF